MNFNHDIEIATFKLLLVVLPTAHSHRATSAIPKWRHAAELPYASL